MRAQPGGFCQDSRIWPNPAKTRKNRSQPWIPGILAGGTFLAWMGGFSRVRPGPWKTPPARGRPADPGKSPIDHFLVQVWLIIPSVIRRVWCPRKKGGSSGTNLKGGVKFGVIFAFFSGFGQIRENPEKPLRFGKTRILPESACRGGFSDFPGFSRKPGKMADPERQSGSI